MAYSGSRGLVGVCQHDRTGEVLVWSLPLPMRRKPDGSWIGGEEALKNVPTADELKDDWTIVWDPDASMLVAEGFASLRERAGSIELQIPDRPPMVSRHNGTGEILISSLPFPIRRVHGVWIGGAAAIGPCPPASEYRREWTILEDEEARAVLEAARVALGPE